MVSKCIVERCQHCPFKGQLVGGKGPEDSPFVIIGESPGIQEVKQGEPFVGPSGQVLAAGLDQHPPGSYPEPYIINAFKCFPGKDKDPATLAMAAQACHGQLEAELKKYPRKVILALGNAALWTTTNQYSSKITKERGKLFPSEYAEIGVVASTHPAYLLRGNGSFRQFKADVDYAIRLVQGHPPRSVPEVTWELLDTPEKIRAWCQSEAAQTAPLVAADYETTGFSHRLDKLICAGYSINGTHSVIIPLLNKPELLPYLRFVHSLPGRFCWHNGKFDIKFAHIAGCDEATVHEDTMLMSYALDETRGIHDLETVSSDWLGSPNWKAELKKFIPKGGSYADAPRDKLYLYLAKDLANTYNLYGVLRPLVANDKLSERLYTRTLIPASAYLAEVEKNGMMVDLQRVQENERAMQKEADAHAEALNKIALAATGSTVNPNSPIQLATLLYDHLRIKAKSRSTDEKTIKDLQHPAVEALRQYRKVHKGLSTYVKPAVEHIADDGRVHPTYLIHGTATGRLACRDPNLQNIPRDPKLRGQFIAREGYLMLEVDLNQAELRSLAILSGDEALCRIYTDPTSKGLHEEVRADLYGYPKDWSEEQTQKYMTKWYTDTIDRVLEEQKMRAKNVNFGIVYGITPFGLAEQIEDTPQEASRMLSAWAKKFPTAWGFIQKCRQAPLLGKNLVTVFGHKKRFGIVTQENLMMLQNEAANFPHQSSASTITLHGGIILEPKLRDYDTRIINTVHDSILFEVPNDKAVVTEVSKLAEKTLEQVPVDWGLTRIPFKAESKVGNRWGSLVGFSKWKWDEPAEIKHLPDHQLAS